MKKFKNYRELIQKAQERAKEKIIEDCDCEDKYADYDEIDVANAYLQLLEEKDYIEEQLEELRELIANIRE